MEATAPKEHDMRLKVIELGAISLRTKDFSGNFAWDDPFWAFRKVATRF